jgi:glycosyltransferase involved in cell wall biosynthesis
VISVIIPARNAARTLAAQLSALADQTPPHRWRHEDWEVIVADNGSEDGTAAVVAAWAGRLPVRIVDASARPGPAAARNLGAAAARGVLLAFTDADDVVREGWLAALVVLHRRSSTRVFATGPMSRFADGAAPQSGRQGAMRPPRHLGFLPYADGTNLVVSADLFHRHGGFDESRRTGEDVDLSWRIQLAGVDLEVVPGLRVAVRERTDDCAVFHQYFRYGSGDVAVARDYRPRGLPRQDPWRVARAYAGLVARIPLLFMPSQRTRWLHQLGRRVGRIAAWWTERTVLW